MLRYNTMVTANQRQSDSGEFPVNRLCSCNGFYFVITFVRVAQMVEHHFSVAVAGSNPAPTWGIPHNCRGEILTNTTLQKRERHETSRKHRKKANQNVA